MSETRAITVEQVLPYAAEKIWHTLTTSELIAKWLMPNDFAAAIGHRFNFRTRPMGDWDGVVRCEVSRGIRDARIRHKFDRFWQVMQYVVTDNRLWFEVEDLLWKLDRKSCRRSASVSTTSARAGSSRLMISLVTRSAK